MKCTFVLAFWKLYNWYSKKTNGSLQFSLFEKALVAPIRSDIYVNKTDFFHVHENTHRKMENPNKWLGLRVYITRLRGNLPLWSLRSYHQRRGVKVKRNVYKQSLLKQFLSPVSLPIYFSYFSTIASLCFFPACRGSTSFTWQFYFLLSGGQQFSCKHWYVLGFCTCALAPGTRTWSVFLGHIIT